MFVRLLALFPVELPTATSRSANASTVWTLHGDMEVYTAIANYSGRPPHRRSGRRRADVALKTGRVMTATTAQDGTARHFPWCMPPLPASDSRCRPALIAGTWAARSCSS
ncbi:MAG: hypothetical protein U1U88_001814 [Lawsonella clevelandensis]